MRRLAYYVIGLSIGFLLLGMFQRLRTQEHAARMAAREAQSVPAQGAASTPAQPSGPTGSQTGAGGSNGSREPQGAQSP